MSRLLERYHFDLSDIQRLESLYGEPLPDILAPLRLVDADVEAIRAQLDEYSALAADLQAVHQKLLRANASGLWDTALTKLTWIAVIILLIVAALHALLSLLLVVMGALCRLLTEALSWAAGVIAVLAIVIVAARAGQGSSGRIAMIWAALQTVFRVVSTEAMGIVSSMTLLSAAVCDIAGRGVMSLSQLS